MFWATNIRIFCEKGGRECAHEPLFGTFFPSGPLGVLLGGAWVAQTDPKGAKTIPWGSRKGGFGLKKCQKYILKPRTPCNEKTKNCENSTWVDHDKLVT